VIACETDSSSIFDLGTAVVVATEVIVIVRLLQTTGADHSVLTELRQLLLLRVVQVLSRVGLLLAVAPDLEHLSLILRLILPLRPRRVRGLLWAGLLLLASQLRLGQVLSSVVFLTLHTYVLVRWLRLSTLLVQGVVPALHWLLAVLGDHVTLSSGGEDLLVA